MREARLAFGFSEQLVPWVAERIQHLRSPDFGPCETIGIVRGDRLIAAAIYHDYIAAHEIAQFTIASESPLWATKGVISGLLHYAFRQMNVYTLYTLTLPSNERALKVNEHIGLKRKTIIPHAFGRKRHAVLCQMTEPEYSKRYEVNHG